MPLYLDKQHGNQQHPQQQQQQHHLYHQPIDYSNLQDASTQQHQQQEKHYASSSRHSHIPDHSFSPYTNSISHAFNIEHTRAGQQQQEEEQDRQVPFHSPHQTVVTDEELQALLDSRPWRSSEVNMDESYEDLAPYSSASPSTSAALWPANTAYDSSSNMTSLLWSDVHDPSHIHHPPALDITPDMPWNSVGSLSPFSSEPSISPSSMSNAFLTAISHTNNHHHSLSNRREFTSPLSSESNSSLSSPQNHYIHSLQQQQQRQQQHTSVMNPADATMATNATTSPLNASPLSRHDQGLLRTTSLQQGRQRPMQRQHTSSSLSSTSSNPSSIAATSSSKNSYIQPVSLTSVSAQSRASTITSQYEASTSTLSAGPMGKIQESAAMDYTNESGISTSLSAELAGLGLNMTDYNVATRGREGGKEELMDSTDMQRTTSSSSSSTTKTSRAHDQGDSSYLSQATSSLESSGLDDSLLSLQSNTRGNSRWIHGKDTPPSSPAPSFGPRSRLSPLSEQKGLGKVSTSTRSFSIISPYRRLDEFGVLNKGLSTASSDWSSTWPQTLLGQLDSTSSLSPFQQQYSKSGALPLASSSSTQSLQDKRSIRRHSRGLTLSEAIGDSGRFSRRSNDSIHSDTRISRSSRESIENRRIKRMSASFVSEAEARRLHEEKQSQYDQVSDALDTLRRFLRQRDEIATMPESSSTSSSATNLSNLHDAFATAGPSRDRSISSLGQQVSNMLADASRPRQTIGTLRQKTLRHPPTGPLPPRGSVYTSPSASITFSQSIPHQDTSRVEEERMATLEDLAKRVRQMKDENQRLLEDL